MEVYSRDKDLLFVVESDISGTQPLDLKLAPFYLNDLDYKRLKEVLDETDYDTVTAIRKGELFDYLHKHKDSTDFLFSHIYAYKVSFDYGQQLELVKQVRRLKCIARMNETLNG